MREEARLVQSSSEESLPEDDEQSVTEGEGPVGGARSEVGRFLSAEDEGGVKNFVVDFVAQRLVPHLEAVLKNLNEWVSPSIIYI